MQSKNDSTKKKDLYCFLILPKNDILRYAFVPHSVTQCVTHNAPQNALWDSFLDALSDAPNETFRNALRDVLCDTLYTHYGGE